MQQLRLLASCLLTLSVLRLIQGFAPIFKTIPSSSSSSSLPPPLSAPSAVVPRSSSSSRLYAIGVLAKKAKQAALKEYVAQGIDDQVMDVYKTMKEKMSSVDDLSQPQAPGPLQISLTKRKGTITVIAEYKRKTSEAETGFINEMFDPELLSPTFREFGASAIAVMADERMGGCTYRDIDAFVEEQRRSKNEVPGPIPVINNDLIVDELQIAQSVASQCVACVISLAVVGVEECETLIKAAKAVNLETLVVVSTREQAQQAVDLGARMLLVKIVDENPTDRAALVEAKWSVVHDLTVPENDDGRPQDVCRIAYISARNNKQLLEVEEAWALRDKGFNAVWVGEALYKSGVDATEHPGAIIRAMKSKSSVRWASPKASSGRGEGAREYLGDILM